ncbi:MAG TPA: protein kinase [Chthoniobacteraceae bacterium]|nr:protein kinase [Chthoniobacteraceae bacterium]
MPPPDSSPDPPSESPSQICPSCGALIDISEQEPLTRIFCPVCEAPQLAATRIHHFELVEVVGRGGMGVVYKARDTSLDRYVAVKLLRRETSGNAELIAQLEKEAAITAAINHPHVVRVFTTGTDQGRFYIAMELVDKGTLDDLIKLQGRVAESQVLQLGAQIAQGLRAAQQAGLIHRDVKPGNILFADAHTAKIVDFGLALFMEEEEQARGEVWGTPYYVAPEKLDNKPEDFRSDIYSLGATLFHALAGRPPFEAEDASRVALKHLKSQAVSLQTFAPHVSGETAYVINRTLLKDPNDRYQSYDELIEHLDYASKQLEEKASKPRATRRLVIENEAQQKAMGWITLAAAALVVILSAGAFVFREQLFGGGQRRAGATTPTSTATESSANDYSFPDARKKLLARDTAGAIAGYHQHASNPKLRADLRAWAGVGEGLSQLTAGQVPEARATFQRIAQAAPSSGTNETTPFLTDLARKLASEQPIDPAEARGFDKTNHEALGPLLFGLQNWHLGRVDAAAALFRQFRQTAPTGAAAWIAELKPLIVLQMESYAEFEMNAERLKAAGSPEARKRAIEALHKVKGPFAERVAELVSSVKVPPPAVPKQLGEWSHVPLGSPAIAGEATEKDGAFALRASGADLWGTHDSGHFLYRAWTGDGALVAHVTKLEKVDPWSKAGLLMRENLAADGRNVALIVSPANGVALQIRPKAGVATTSTKVAGLVAPVWLKLVREGDRFTGFHSTDGQSWTEFRSEQMPNLPKTLHVGLGAASHNEGRATTATFEAVRIEPLQ